MLGMHESWLLCVQVPASHNTQETCTTYNVLKIARSLLQWTGAGSYADFYERALLNGILGTQRLPRKLTEQLALQHSASRRGSVLADAAVPKHRARLSSRARQSDGEGEPECWALCFGMILSSVMLAGIFAGSSTRNDTDAPGPGATMSSQALM